MANQMTFEPHGDFTLRPQGNVILVNVAGAWNLEGKKTIMADVFALIARLTLKRFSMLVDITDFELGTPDFQRLGVAEKISLIKRGLYKTAYVNRGNCSAQVEQIIQMQPDIASFEWQVFPNQQDAQRWLATR